jgi:hypothetical protein
MKNLDYDLWDRAKKYIGSPILNLTESVVGTYIDDLVTERAWIPNEEASAGVRNSINDIIEENI